MVHSLGVKDLFNPICTHGLWSDTASWEVSRGRPWDEGGGKEARERWERQEITLHAKGPPFPLALCIIKPTSDQALRKGP